MINGDFICLGDTHFFDKNFNIDYFENQMRFYEKQLFPYMEDKEIKYIIQTGDLFDNRTTINIHLFNLFTNRFCDALKSYGFELITFLGNHDIVFKNTLDFNMVKYLEVLYPNNIKVIQESCVIDINSRKVGLVPWLVPTAKLDPILMETSEYVFGHFELNGFNHSKYVVDDKSELSADVFKNQKKVFSGHYHLNHTKGKVHYIGTPYQADFGEFGNKVGFYHFKEDFSYEFHQNTESNVYVKFSYDDRLEVPLRMYYDDDKFYDMPKDTLKSLCNLEAKFNVEHSEDGAFEEYLLVLKENSVNFSFTNTQEIEALVNPDKIIDTTNLKTTEHFILDYMNEYNPELAELTKQILKEVSEYE